jgi:transcriptional regulator with XRE-family HTH domain
MALGAFLRGQRKVANLSLRELSRLTDISNAYLSQVERGVHEPSVRVLRSIAQALDLPASAILARAGLGEEEITPAPKTEEAIRADSRLSEEQKQALIAVYRSYCRDAEAGQGDHQAHPAAV